MLNCRPESILAADVPSEEFFSRLEAHYRKSHPEASDEIIRHVISLERLCWHACAFGLSFKAVKAQLAGSLVKMLGEYVGRGRRLKDPAKTEAISKFPPPNTLKQLQEFLGMFNYIRPG